jgi:hypothetical protein
MTWRFALSRALALAALIARVGLVDDVNAALATHDAAILVAQLHGLERVTDLHDSELNKKPRPRRGEISKAGGKYGPNTPASTLFSAHFSQ